MEEEAEGTSHEASQWAPANTTGTQGAAVSSPGLQLK